MRIDKAKFFTACAKSNLTFLDVVKKAGVSRNVIVSVNKGKNINSKTLGLLADVLKTEPCELLLKEGV